MQPYSLFISDLHLDESRPEHLAALKQLLHTHAGQAEALYILGDLFEAWIGDDDDAPFNLEAIQAFRKFADTTSKLYFLHGNRDFLLGTDFEQQSGGTLLPEGTQINLYGRPTLLMHGDSLCTDDADYMAFRAQVRSPEWQHQLLAKPLQERRQIAAQMRAQSMANQANRADNITDVNNTEVIRQMRAHQVTDLIHGHTHRPKVHRLPLGKGLTGKRWVLGDWGALGWLIRATPTGNTLESWPIDPHST